MATATRPAARQQLVPARAAAHAARKKGVCHHVGAPGHLQQADIRTTEPVAPSAPKENASSGRPAAKLATVLRDSGKVAATFPAQATATSMPAATAAASMKVHLVSTAGLSALERRFTRIRDAVRTLGVDEAVLRNSLESQQPLPAPNANWRVYAISKSTHGQHRRRPVRLTLETDPAATQVIPSVDGALFDMIASAPRVLKWGREHKTLGLKC